MIQRSGYGGGYGHYADNDGSGYGEIASGGGFGPIDSGYTNVYGPGVGGGTGCGGVECTRSLGPAIVSLVEAET